MVLVLAVASEAVAAATWRLGSARRILVSAEGGIGRYEPLSDDRNHGLMVRGAAALGWRLSDAFGLGLQYEILHEEDYRTMRQSTVMLVVEAGDRPRRLHAREELTPLTARGMLSDEE